MLTRTQKTLTTVTLVAAGCTGIVASRAQAGGSRVPFTSEFHSAMVDASMSPGQKYRVKVNVENAGAKAWLPKDVALEARWSTGPYSPTGSDVGGFTEKIPREVTSNLRIPLEGTVTGPSMPGDWTLTLRMTAAGKPFGDTRLVKIKALADFKESLDIDLPSKIEVNRKYVAKVASKNVGPSDWEKNRITLRARVVKATSGNINDILGKNLVIFKMSKTVLAGETFVFLVPFTAKASGDYDVEFYLWDEEENDEVGSSHKVKVAVR